MTTSPMDAPPLDGLAAAFRLPPEIAENETYAALHTEIVDRLRREAAGLPMKTVQNLLIERIAYFYVAMKMREDTGEGSLREQKELLTFWLSMTQEFNRLLEKNTEKLRDEMVLKVQNILKEALPLVQDVEDRKALRRELSAKFAENEL